MKLLYSGELYSATHNSREEAAQLLKKLYTLTL